MRHYICLVFMLIPICMMAQKTINGKVTDVTKNPLPGASILIQGTTKGVVTDFDGNFSVTVDEMPVTLIVAFLGFEEKTIVVDNETSVSIVLEEDASLLEEVVVIGYGQLERKDLSGSVSTIKEDSDISMQYNDVGSLLQGRSPGVQVLGNTGAPGAGVSIRIRGTNSLRGNNEPLYVVDGVIINSAGEDVANATNDVNERQIPQNGLTGINPRDIETMEVLKDASATAIYGSRGANGVIIITTKKGVQGKPRFNAYASSTITQFANKIDVLDPLNYAQFRNTRDILVGNPTTYEIRDNQIFENILDAAPGEPTQVLTRPVNWQDEVFKQTFSNIAGLDISGANGKNNYYISANIGEQRGIIPNTFLNTANFRANYSNQVSERLQLITRAAIYFGRGSMNQGANSAGGNRSFVRQLIGFNPLIGSSAEDGDELGPFNPLSFLEGFEEKINEKRINLAFNLTYKISNAFKYQLRAGGNYRNKSRSRWYGEETFKGGLTNGNLSLSYLEKSSYTIDNLLLFNKRFNKKHRLNATFGISYDGNITSGSTYEIGQFPIKELRELTPELGEQVISPFSTFGPLEDNIFSVISRAIYTLKDKYTFTGTLRSDSSSKFAEGNRTGYFPSFAFSWRANKESFLKSSKFVNDLKFRASWGQVGNQGIPPYQTIPAYSNSGYSDSQNNSVLAVQAANIANPDLTWEKTTQFNLGTDFSFFNSFLSGSLDAYKKTTDDLLISVPAPLSTGFSSIIANRGGIENEGIDLALNLQLFDNDNFSWSVGGNISSNRNKITGLGGITPSPIVIDNELVERPFYFGNRISSGLFFSSPANAFIEGQPIGVFWGFKTNGIYSNDAQAADGPTFFGNENQPGDIAYVDLNGDGNVNDTDRTIIGDPNPDFTFGINSNLSFKKFDLSVLFTGSQGNDIMNGNLLAETATNLINNIRPEAYFDAWTPQNTSAAFPRINSSTASEISDRLVEDGSYVRLSNVTLSYTLDLEKPTALIKSIKLYGSANNLFTITNYSGYDPELTSFLYDGTIVGVDWTGTPNVQTFVLGANINF